MSIYMEGTMANDNFDGIENAQITRRNFLKTLSGVVTAFIAATLGFPMVETLVGTISKKKNKLYSKVASLDSIPENKPVDVSFVMTEEDAFIKNTRAHEVWTVKKSDSKVIVFSPICPHLGCRYQWHSDRSLFICPCHHSVFNIDGKVVSGPAPRPLDTLPKKIENNNLYVLWERFKPGVAKKEII
jgi:menaquinol-cytochrome c reductase iron-sulfur subunit